MAFVQRIAPLAVALALATLALGPHAQALTVDAAPLEVLAVEAALDLRGVVAQVTAERVPGHARRVRTRVLVLIEDARWARDDDAAAQVALGAVEVLLPGGRLGGFTTWVPGVPQLRPGDRGRFLLEAVHGEWMPLGYSLGVILDPPPTTTAWPSAEPPPVTR